MSEIRVKPVLGLKFENLTFTFDGATEPLFKNITMTMPTARAVWVRSPGGRGKSTLLRLLAGLYSPTSGSYSIGDDKVSEMSFEEFLPYRLNMGYSFDFGGLLSNKTLSENLLLPLLYHNLVPAEEAVARVEEVIKMFGIEQNKDRRPSAVPGSQRKLVCVLRAFINWPQVVFLDDPLTGLKQDNINDLIHYVEESFSMRGLKQVFFTSESPILANHFKAEELLVAQDWISSRAVA